MLEFNNEVTKDQETLNNLGDLNPVPTSGEIQVVSPLVEGILESGAQTRIEAEKPSWMQPYEESQVAANVDKFMDTIKNNPTDIHLSTQIYKLGEDGAKELMPYTSLYERKISDIMSESKDGSLVNRTLMSLKQELDQINPSVVAKQPISYKIAFVINKTRLPKVQEVLDLVYARKETVASTISGMKQGMWVMADNLYENLEDLVGIYEGLMKGQRMIERDIYFGQLLAIKLSDYSETLTDQLAKQNIESLLADLTTQIINLQTEENVNMQFFAGAQAIAKMTNQQIQNIRGLSRLLERTVLANLGLRVATVELGKTLEITEGMKQAIGDTIADTGKQINKMGDELTKARSQAVINMKGLEEGCRELEEFFEKQAIANKQIIEVGAETSEKLKSMTSRLRNRVEGGHEGMREALL